MPPNDCKIHILLKCNVTVTKIVYILGIKQVSHLKGLKQCRVCSLTIKESEWQQQQILKNDNIFTFQGKSHPIKCSCGLFYLSSVQANSLV